MGLVGAAIIALAMLGNGGVESPQHLRFVIPIGDFRNISIQDLLEPSLSQQEVSASCMCDAFVHFGLVDNAAMKSEKTCCPSILQTRIGANKADVWFRTPLARKDLISASSVPTFKILPAFGYKIVESQLHRIGYRICFVVDRTASEFNVIYGGKRRRLTEILNIDANMSSHGIPWSQSLHSFFKGNREPWASICTCQLVGNFGLFNSAGIFFQRFIDQYDGPPTNASGEHSEDRHNPLSRTVSPHMPVIGADLGWRGFLVILVLYGLGAFGGILLVGWSLKLGNRRDKNNRK